MGVAMHYNVPHHNPWSVVLVKIGETTLTNGSNPIAQFNSK